MSTVIGKCGMMAYLPVPHSMLPIARKRHLPRPLPGGYADVVLSRVLPKEVEKGGPLTSVILQGREHNMGAPKGSRWVEHPPHARAHWTVRAGVQSEAPTSRRRRVWPCHAGEMGALTWPGRSSNLAASCPKRSNSASPPPGASTSSNSAASWLKRSNPVARVYCLGRWARILVPGKGPFCCVRLRWVGVWRQKDEGWGGGSQGEHGLKGS